MLMCRLHFTYYSGVVAQVPNSTTYTNAYNIYDLHIMSCLYLPVDFSYNLHETYYITRFYYVDPRDG